ncbi:CPBP family intramembrane metalloprotease [Candidatus Bathyarchaeota archaeon]|nr:CPBP family intramembrane metalloprotease [Candidatus Bathyarchaeota archaeon]
MGTAQRVVVFVILSYTTALLLDVTSLYGWLPLILWGFVRMWSVSLSVVLCLVIFRESVSSNFRRFLGFSTRLLRLYLLSPLLIYAALGIYISLAVPLNLFDFSAYIDLIAEEVSSGLAGEQAAHSAVILAYAQIALAYATAITLNAFLALGEEIGWRGYLYNLLGSKPGVATALGIGVLWGLWHASAIILLGYNYQINRLVGVALFTTLTMLFTYPQLSVTEMAGGSVLPATSFHGAINAIWGLTMVATRLRWEDAEILLGLGLMGIIAWIVTNIVFQILMKKARFL